MTSVAEPGVEGSRRGGSRREAGPRQAFRARSRATEDASRRRPDDRGGEDDRVDPARLFAGPLTPLRHVAAVADGTVVIIFVPGQVLQVREPRDLLLPDRHPFRPRVGVMAVNARPVRLRIVVAGLVTADRRHLSRVQARIAVQVATSHQRVRLLGLAAQHGDALGYHLADAVRCGVETAIRAAVGALEEKDLRRPGIAAAIRERWLPRSVAGEVVTVLEFAVDPPPREHRPTSEPPSITGQERTDLEHRPTAEPPSITGQERTDLELTTDVRLRRIWQRRLPGRVRGLAGAKVGSQATVIVAVTQEPPAYELRQLGEDLATAYEVKAPVVVVCTGRTYPELVRQWWAGLDLPSGLLVAVSEDVAADRLLIILPSELGHHATADSRWQGPEGSQAVALRRLLPHARIDFGSAGPDGRDA